MRFRQSVLVLAIGALSALLVVAPVAASGATVFIERGGSSCYIDPVDLPGLANEFQADSSTVTITPNGMLIVTCTGRLPDDFSPDPTLVLDVLCAGDTATTSGTTTPWCSTASTSPPIPWQGQPTEVRLRNRGWAATRRR